MDELTNVMDSLHCAKAKIDFITNALDSETMIQRTTISNLVTILSETSTQLNSQIDVLGSYFVKHHLKLAA